MATGFLTFYRNSGIQNHRDRRQNVEGGGCMKTSKRLVFGLLSSLLLAVGFVRAADRLDPMNNEPSVSVGGPMAPAEGCTNPCSFADDVR